jgi:hypothetical protein
VGLQRRRWTRHQRDFPFSGWPAFDTKGNLYIADQWNNRVRKIDTAGMISTIAGTGTGGFAGDGGPAINAQLWSPRGLTFSGGSLYIADGYNNRIRKIDSAGTISTVAGNGTAGFSGDAGPATNAELFLPSGLTVQSKSLYIADMGNHRIRKVDSAGMISTVAGNGSRGYNGDGGPATSAMLYFPTSVTVDRAGNLYSADEALPHVRKVDPAGIISTKAGNGEYDFSSDNNLSTNAQFFHPYSVAADNNGNVYIVDTFNERIRKVDASGVVSHGSWKRGVWL